MTQSSKSPIRLSFLGWERPILRSAARAILGSVPAGAVADLSEDLIALPGARAGRRLLEILVEEAEGEGRALRPPRIASVGSLPEHLYVPSRPGPIPAVERSAWRWAVKRLRPEELSVVAPAAVEIDPEARRNSLVAILADLHARVGAAGLDFADVARRCRSGFLFCDEGRWEVLALAQKEYAAVLAAGGWSDREAERRRAIREDRVVWDGRLWIVAAPELSPIVRAFVGALRLPVPARVLVGAPDRLSYRFDEMGCVVSEAWKTERSELPDSAIRIVTAPAEQADAMVEHLRVVARGRSAEEITVGVPDRDVVPYIVERLSEEGIPSRYAEGRPIERTAAYRLLAAVEAYVERRDAEAFAALLRHPWVEAAIERLWGGSGPPPRGVPSELDRYRTLHLPTRMGGQRTPLPTGGERVSDGPASAVARARDLIDGLLAPLEGSRRLSQWPEQIRKVLRELLPHELAGDVLDVVSRIAEALEGLEALSGLPGAAAALDEGAVGPTALLRVMEELAGTAVPPEVDAGAVELLGWLELALDDAPILVVTGANEPFLPESVTSDPFLPHTLQESLGLLGNDGRWGRDLLLVQTVMATRPHVLFVAGRQDSDGNPLHISRLLLADSPRVTAARIREFLGTSERVPLVGSSGGHSFKGSALELPPDRVISAPEPIGRLAVTAFRTILADPYRFALERILGLDGEDDRARELGPLGFGSLAHTVLEEWAKRGERDASDDRWIRAELDAILDRASASWFGSTPLPAVRIQVEQLRRRLRAFARWQAAWVADGWRIRGTELSFGGEAAALVVDGIPMVIGGKVDRVDENVESGEWCILDYKTSEIAKGPDEAHRTGREGQKQWIDLQLPLYRHLASALLDAAGRPVVPAAALERLRVGYVPLSRGPAPVRTEWADWSEAEWREAIQQAHEVVRIVRRNLFEHDGSARVDPEDVLAGVLGGGVLLLAEDEEGGTLDD